MTDLFDYIYFQIGNNRKAKENIVFKILKINDLKIERIDSFELKINLWPTTRRSGGLFPKPVVLCVQFRGRDSE